MRGSGGRVQALRSGQRKVLREELLLSFGGGVDHLTNSVLFEYRIELRPVHFPIDEMWRESRQIVRLHGVLAPEDHCAPAVMEIVCGLGSELRQHFADAPQLLCARAFLALR